MTDIINGSGAKVMGNRTASIPSLKREVSSACFSIIIPTKDEPTIQKLVDGIHKTIKQNHEIIIVDKSRSRTWIAENPSRYQYLHDESVEILLVGYKSRFSVKQVRDPKAKFCPRLRVQGLYARDLTALAMPLSRG
jgi:hypothetical protein